MKVTPPDYILSVTPYSPGKPIEELEREFGITGSIKLASNENPLGPSPRALEAIRQGLDGLHHYPDGSGYYLVEKLAETLGVRPENIVLGNGSDEIIGMLTKALLYPGDEVVMTDPSFSMYEIMTRIAGAVPVTVPLTGLSVDMEAVLGAVTSSTRLVFLTNPNNPTGTVFSQAAFEKFMAQLPPSVIVVVDEAYIEFVRDPSCLNALDLLDDNRPLVALRTFSKAYGLAGLRVGYGLMPPELAELLNRVRKPFNVNSLAQTAALAALDDGEFLAHTLKTVHDGLDSLYGALEQKGISCFPTQANFFLIDLQQEANGVVEALLKKGVIVRSMRSYGYPSCIRVTVGTHEENVRFIDALTEVLS